MPLHNRSADGQSDAHAAALRGVEGVEHCLNVLRRQSDASVAHGHAHAIAVLAGGSDQQLSRAAVDVGHRIGGVAEQIENHLLELGSVAGHERKIVELGLNDDAMSLQVIRRQLDDLTHSRVQIGQF